MNKQEFENLIGSECHDWETVQFVYTWHPSINDVGGKEQIAKIYKEGYTPAIHKMVPESIKAARAANVEIKHVVGRLAEYDVLFGLCYNFVGIQSRRVFSDLVNKLGALEPDEYFTLQRDFEGKTFPDFNWVAVYCVPGGSEGTYMHIDIINGDKRVMWAMGKTLSDGRNSITNMYKAAAVAAEFFYSDRLARQCDIT